MARKLSVVFLLALVAGAVLASPAAAMNLGRLIAPPAACPGQTGAQVSTAAREQAMRCMTNFARRHAGRGRLGDAEDLDRSALDKVGDIVRCDSFSHYACGRQFTYWMQRVGYASGRCWRVGENLAWGIGELGSVRAIFRAWIHSPEHRANILGHYSQIGIGLTVGRLDGHADVDVWAQHFGSHCGQSRRPAVRRVAGVLDAHVAR
ncbi:MAG TPA: CAP domain-containing protein [Solirubrobacterales bacterium]|nr:CAP domain-containing protein [Solirubrobacterales bacterium]